METGSWGRTRNGKLTLRGAKGTFPCQTGGSSSYGTAERFPVGAVLVEVGHNVSQRRLYPVWKEATRDYHRLSRGGRGAEGEEAIIGLHEEFFPRWHAFLVLAGVRSVSKRDALRMAAIRVAHFLAGGFVGFGVGLLLGFLTDHFRGDDKLGGLIVVASTLGGMLLGLVYVENHYFWDGPLTAAQRINRYYMPISYIFFIYGVRLVAASRSPLAGAIIVAASLGIGWCIAYGFIQQKLRQIQRKQAADRFRQEIGATT